MRVTMVCLLLLFMVSLPLCADIGDQHAQAAARDLVGAAAPRLVVKTIDGQFIDLAKWYGKKAVYLEFWATWYVPYRKQMPHLKQIYREAKPDRAVVAVDIGADDTLQDVRQYRWTMGLRMLIVFDDGIHGCRLSLERDTSACGN